MISACEPTLYFPEGMAVTWGPAGVCVIAVHTNLWKCKNPQNTGYGPRVSISFKVLVFNILRNSHISVWTQVKFYARSRHLTLVTWLSCSLSQPVVRGLFGHPERDAFVSLLSLWAAWCIYTPNSCTCLFSIARCGWILATAHISNLSPIVDIYLLLILTLYTQLLRYVSLTEEQSRSLRSI